MSGGKEEKKDAENINKNNNCTVLYYYTVYLLVHCVLVKIFQYTPRLKWVLLDLNNLDILARKSKTQRKSLHLELESVQD